MPYEVIIPETVSREFSNIVSSMRGYRKPAINSIISKNAPAFITVVDYKETSSDDFTYSTKRFGAPSALSNKFFLQGIDESRREKAQILETFSEPLVLFFNQKTKVYNFKGTFLDAHKMKAYGLKDQVIYNWAMAFRKFYEEELRGTMLAELNKIALMTVNSQVYMGYPISLDINTNAGSPMANAFSMTWIIIDQLLLPPSQYLSNGQSTEYTKELRDLYSVETTLSGARASRIEELEQEEKRLIDQLKELEAEEERIIAEIYLDPASTSPPVLLALRDTIEDVRTELDAIQTELIDLSVKSAAGQAF